jgi:hypothetical protein
MHNLRRSLMLIWSSFRHLDRPMKVASRPACSFFCFFPIRDSFRLLPAFEPRAALVDDFFGRPLTRFPILLSLATPLLFWIEASLSGTQTRDGKELKMWGSLLYISGHLSIQSNSVVVARYSSPCSERDSRSPLWFPVFGVYCFS